MRTSIALSLGLLILLSSAAQAQTLKVLSLNFNTEIVAFDDRDETIRDIRFEVLANWIETEKPDILFICEAWNYRGYPSVVIPLAHRVGYDYFYRIGEGFPGLEIDSDAVLVRKDFHMTKKHLVMLPHSAFHFGSELHGVIPLGSITQAVGAKLTLENGDPLFIYSTHLIGNTEPDRLDQMAALDKAAKNDVAKAKISWDQANVLVAGDMNSDPLSSPIQLMQVLKYDDTWMTAHPDHSLDAQGATICEDPRTPCFNPFDLGSGQLPAQNTMGVDRRIDFIFAKGPTHKTLASTLMFTHPFHQIFMSDHYGVLSTIAFGGDPSAVASNPLNDSVGLPPEAPTLVFDVTDATLHASVPLQVVKGRRGFALINSSAIALWATIEGPGQVFPSWRTRLKNGHASSFVFERSGEYRLHLFNRRGEQSSGVIRVQ